MGFWSELFGAGRRRQVPDRVTEMYPRLVQLGSPRESRRRATFKPVARNLRYFSRTPYARRAINTIKAPIANAEWEIVPRKGVDSTPELERQIEVATYCFDHPNATDNFSSLLEQVIEDILCGAGAIETEVGADRDRPLWMWPTDGLSIQMYAGWDGDQAEPRYYQTSGYGGIGNLPNDGIQLLDRELIYIRPNVNTADPFGIGPLEVAFMAISRQLGVGDFAGNVSSNAKPSMLLQMAGVDESGLNAFRAYWRNEVEGQGQTPIVAAENASAVRLWPEGDKALYLQYQQFLIREIATAFDISPMNLGIEHDVNRSTAEIGENRDWDAAVRPMAEKIASHLTREALHSRLGFYGLEVRFPGLNREDESQQATILASHYKSNFLTTDEARARIGLPSIGGMWGDKLFIDTQVAIEAARGMKTNIDRSMPLPDQTTPGGVQPDGE